MRASRSALARPVGLRPLLLAALAALGRGGFVGRGHGLIITRGSSKPAPGLGQAVREQAVVAMRASEPTQAAALAPQCGDHCFVLEVDLGNGAGVVHQELAPLFSESELLTVRMPVPCELHAEASHGVLRISVNGHGLYAGDVLRACSTFRAKLADVWLGLVPVNVAPAKCLFLVDGVPVGDVIQALCENTPDRTQDVILIFERPAKKPMSGPWF